MCPISQTTAPKSQHRDPAAAVAAEGKCRADIDELANMFSRQNLEWGTGFVCWLSVAPGCPRQWVCFLPASNFALFFLSFNLLYSFIIIGRVVAEIGEKYLWPTFEIEVSSKRFSDISGFRPDLSGLIDGVCERRLCSHMGIL